MPGVGILYYVVELATFLAGLYFGSKKQKNESLERASELLANTQAGTITAQAERIAVLENENRELKETISRMRERVEYLEEVVGIHGHSQVVREGPGARQ